MNTQYLSKLLSANMQTFPTTFRTMDEAIWTKVNVSPNESNMQVPSTQRESMIDRQEPIVINSVNTSWVAALLLTSLSLALWSEGVQQLATWSSIVPAMAMLTSLYAIVASIYLLSFRSRLTRMVVPTSTFTIGWSLAIAIGL